ncbi:helix-turn-helix transcriptional regulator [Acetobacter senegalensis]|uniref:helix-turn-helix transcriptional regulator n=1 Tax=Acetobacter senegalensis TaxID=446692 RepID=UPI0007770705|nr:AraC family transcriptional regulator [Acetobacter senegalensis]
MSVEILSRVSRTQMKQAHAFSPSYYKDVDKLGREAALQGRMRTFTLREGLELGVFDLYARRDFMGTFSASPQLVIVLITEGLAYGTFRHRSDHAPSPRLNYQTGDVIVACNLAAGETTFGLTAGQKFSGLELRVSFDLLEQLMPGFLAKATSHDRPVQVIGKAACWMARLSRTFTLGATARTLRSAAVDGRRSLMLEGFSLCLLDEVLEAFDSDKKAALWRQAGRYEACIREAAALLTTHLAEPWTIKMLAERVGLSEKRLKDGFQKYYQNGPYGFLQKIRMDRAKSLLMRQTTSVTDVALQVGYSNSSHFAKLFKREFGISPSKVPMSGLP